VLCVEGDSAFGFSGMEFETMARYRLPIVTVIFNNSGIYSGFEKELYHEIVDGEEPGVASPATALLPQVQYEKLAKMVGHVGEVATSLKEVRVTENLKKRSKRTLIPPSPGGGRRGSGPC